MIDRSYNNINGVPAVSSVLMAAPGNPVWAACLGYLLRPTVPDVSRSRHNSDLMLIVPQCANELFINKVARETFGFSGFVVSGAL